MTAVLQLHELSMPGELYVGDPVQIPWSAFECPLVFSNELLLAVSTAVLQRPKGGNHSLRAYVMRDVDAGIATKERQQDPGRSLSG